MSSTAPIRRRRGSAVLGPSGPLRDASSIWWTEPIVWTFCGFRQEIASKPFEAHGRDNTASGSTNSTGSALHGRARTHMPSKSRTTT